MKESVITVNFDVESEAYQALSEIKRHPDGSGYFVSAASLIKKENGHIVLKDGFDTGIDTTDDAAYGSLIGSLCGIWLIDRQPGWHIGWPAGRTVWRQHGRIGWKHSGC